MGLVDREGNGNETLTCPASSFGPIKLGQRWCGRAVHVRHRSGVVVCDESPATSATMVTRRNERDGPPEKGGGRFIVRRPPPTKESEVIDARRPPPE